MYSRGPLHMDEQRQEDQLEPTYSSSVSIRDVFLKTCRKQSTIGWGGERGSGISVLMVRHDDDDCHPQTYCFVVSQLFSVARHVGGFKLELKPALLYVRLSVILLSHHLTYVSSGIIWHYVVAFISMPNCIPIHFLCIFIVSIRISSTFSFLENTFILSMCIKWLIFQCDFVNT